MPLLTQNTVQRKLAVLPNCNACGAASACQYPKQKPPKRGDIVVVVGRPEADKPDSIANTFPEGLRTLCNRVGIPPDSLTVVAASACPGASEGSWKHCQPLLASTLASLQPKLVIPYGPAATQAVVGRYWQHPAELYDRWYGQQIPERTLNAWICPVGYAARELRNFEATNMWAYRWLRGAFSKTSRPWTSPPKPVESDVQCIYKHAEIVAALQEASRQSVVAFDYETTGLKPEWPIHEIVSMAVAWTEGDRIVCYSFPVSKAEHEAVRGFLASSAKKVAANMKFEDRWSWSKLGVRVNKWYWDTMLAAHWENPIDGITGLKFQAFASLGVPFYAGDVEAFFDAPSDRERNRIHQVPIQSLLIYNGVDAILELILASKQMVANEIIETHFVPEEYLPC